MNRVLTRQARRTDRRVMVDLERDLGDDVLATLPRCWRNLRGLYRGFVAECHGEVVGHVIYRTSIEDRCLKVWSGGVRESHRRQGIGSALVACVENAFFESNRFMEREPCGFRFDRVEALVWEGNRAAQELLKSRWWASRVAADPDEDAVLFSFGDAA
jgi:ribosomal protein S18 acetylase RimI-like enzyme